MPEMPFPARTPSRLAAGAVVLLVALVAGACASEADDDPLTSGGDGASADGGGGGGGEAPDVPEDLDAAFEEAIAAVDEADAADVRAEVALESSLVGAFGITVDGVMTRDDVFDVTGSIDGFGDAGEIEMRSDGEHAWVRTDSGDVGSLLPEGVTWVEMPVGTLIDQGVYGGFAGTFDIVPVLRGLVDVEPVGTDEIGGDPVRVYEGDVDWQAALDAASEDELGGLTESLSLDGAEAEEFVVTAALDAENRLRRFAMEVVAGGGLTGGAGLEAALGFEVAEYDPEVVPPEAPPEDETVSLDDMPELGGLLLGGL